MVVEKKNFCLYKKEASTTQELGKEESINITVVVTDLDQEEEKNLRKHVLLKASKVIYKTGTIITFVAVTNTSSSTPTITSSPAPATSTTPAEQVCFLSLVEVGGAQQLIDLSLEETSEEPTPPDEYYICFIYNAQNEHVFGLYLLPYFLSFFFSWCLLYFDTTQVSPRTEELCW